MVRYSSIVKRKYICLKMENSTSQNLTNSLSNSTEDFFSGVFENRPSKIIFMTFTIVAIPAVLLLLYSIIWYERFGLDVKRTIVNKLTSSFCWIAIQFVIFVNIPDLGRYLFGHYSEKFCLYGKNQNFKNLCSAVNKK